MRHTECPPDVSGTVLGDVRCLMVRVPLDRATESSAGNVEVHVTRLVPPGGSSDLPPILVVPAVAATPNYLGLAPMAQRTGRELVIVDGRGAGHSLPTLACPELTDHATWELQRAPGPALARARYVDAVGRCADRLAGEGVDPTAFTVTETARDLVDVRLALGIERWVVVAIGNAGRFVPTLMAEDGDAVDSVILDSFEAPALDPVSAATDLTPRVIRELLDACSTDRRCAAAHPDAPGLWAEARRAVVRRPLAVGAGELGSVRIDEALLARVVRAVISDGGSSGQSFTPPSVPAILENIRDRGGRLLTEEVGPLLAAQDPFCLGFHTDCLKRMSLASGTYLSVLCSVGPRPTAGLRRESDPVVEVFARRLDPAACERFGGQLAPPTGVPSDWAAPTLVLAGRFAPYAPLPELRALVRALPRASLVIDPAGADNVMPRTECTLRLRRDWVDDPQIPAPEPPCLSRLQVEWYVGER